MREATLKFYQQNRLIIFPIMIVLCCLTLILIVILPQTGKLLGNQAAAGAIQKKSAVLEAKAAELENYDTADLNNKVKFALGSLPAEKDFATAVGFIQNLTATSGFSIASLTLGGDFKDQNTTSYSINLNLLGPIKSLQTLLNNIENSPRLMRVRSMESTTKADSETGSIFLIVDILYAADTGRLGAIDSPLPQLSQTDQEILSELVRLNPAPVVSAGFPTEGQSTTEELPSRGKANPFE